MRINLYAALILLFTGAFVACEDEMPIHDGPYLLFIDGGPATVAPGTSRTYTLGNINNPESYTWSVEGPAVIEGPASGNSVTLRFQSVGEVALIATNGTDSGRKNILVDNVEPAFAVNLMGTDHMGTGVLRSGIADTVFFEFDAPLASDPVVQRVTSGNYLTTGTVGDLVKVNDQEYYLIYTAGEGNGTPAIALKKITATAAYGAETIDSTLVKLFRVDNIDPLANATYSQTAGMDGDEVTMTFTFSEPVMNANPEDTLLYINLARPGMATLRDTLEATAAANVYTYDYALPMGADGVATPDGTVTVSLENVADLAGNELGLVTGTTSFRVDNTVPVGTGSAVNIANQDYVTITFASSEAGTGMYIIMEEDEDAPTTVEEFMETSGVASGSLAIANGTASTTVGLASGTYNVYYLISDEAGNYSPITSSSFVIN